MRQLRLIYYFLFFLFIAAAAVIHSPQSAIAAGFGVSPSSLEFTVEKGSEASRQLTIYNTGADAQFAAISGNPAVTVAPGTAMVGESKSVVATVTATGKKLGKSSGEILISFTPEGSSAGNEVLFSLGTRVGVSLNVVESAMHSANFFVGILTSAAIVVSGLSAYLALRRKSARLLPAGA